MPIMQLIPGYTKEIPAPLLKCIETEIQTQRQAHPEAQIIAGFMSGSSVTTKIFSDQKSYEHYFAERGMALSDVVIDELPR